MFFQKINDAHSCQTEANRTAKVVVKGKLKIPELSKMIATRHTEDCPVVKTVAKRQTKNIRF